MAYIIEKTRNANLEDTAIPNLFITDFMPDAPDGDFVKVYIYAYMCCRQEIVLTHADLAERLGLPIEKVFAAWRYFAERSIVRLSPQTPGDETHFDVMFVDVKGELYGGDNSLGKTYGYGADGLTDPELATLFQKIASICGAPFLDGGDAQRIMDWIEDYGATTEIIEFAWQFCRDERGEKNAKYVEKIVKEWAENGLKTTSDVRDYRARIDARSAVHKSLTEALGLRYNNITAAEEKEINTWIDEYGFTPDRLLELADRTTGVSNKWRYLKGIIRKEMEAEGKGAEGSVGAQSSRSGRKQRTEYYRATQRRNEEAAAARLEEVYAASPEIKKADDEAKMLNMELLKALSSEMRDKKGAVERLNKDIGATAGKRKKLLEKAGFTADYTDVMYDCPLCEDTGMLENGASCDCFERSKTAKAK